MTEKSELCTRVLETLPCSSISDDLGVEENTGTAINETRRDESLFSSSKRESDKRPIIYGNPVAQQFIQLVYNHFKVSHEDQNPITETAKVLKLSETTNYRYKDGSVESEVTPVTRKRKKLRTTDLRESVKQTIQLEIYKMYTEKLHVTLETLSDRLKEREIYHGSQSSLGKVLPTLGFTFRKDDPRRALMEKPDISHMRRVFLKSYMENEALGLAKLPYVFLETWIFSNGSLRKSWQDEDTRSIKKIKSDGNRFIIFHAGGQDGFIDGSSLIFKSKTNSGDYHGEMNSENFENWFAKRSSPQTGRTIHYHLE